MVQLYIPGNTNFSLNGDITLIPTEAEIHAILNGTWEAYLKHPIDSAGRWKYISENAVIKMPSFQENDQLFRITKVSKKDTEVSCEMDPIFYDAMAELFLVDIRPTGQSGENALNYLINNAAATYAVKEKYSASSDISTVNTAYYIYKNFMEAILGNDDNAFLNRWGGEIWFDNYHITVNKQIGSDKGIQIRYGKNIQQDGIEETIDFQNVITRILPKIYNGHSPQTDSGEPYVYSSPLRDTYPVIRNAVYTFSDIKLEEDATEEDIEEGSNVTIVKNISEMRQAIKERVDILYNVEEIDKPSISISIEMALLQNTELYTDYKEIETVSLGDTVHLFHSKLGIKSDARVVELRYNSLKKRTESVVIGSRKRDEFEKISDTSTTVEKITMSNGDVNAERVRGILNAINTQLRYQKSVAQKQDVRAILFEDLDENSNTYGAMALGTQGFQIANRRTANDSDWDWRTAFTAAGGYADALIAGLLSSKDGKSYFNLDSGFLRAINAYIEGTINGSSITGSTITGSTFQTTGTQSWCKLSDGQFEVQNGSAGVELLRNDNLATFAWLGTVSYGFLLNVFGNTIFGIGKSESGGKPESGYIYDPNPTNLSSNNRLLGTTIIENLTTRNTLNAHSIVTNNLSATVTKSRLVEGTTLGDRLMYCYETPTPMFADCGMGKIGDNGECIICIDAIFSETINSSVEYLVFLQKEGEGDLWVKSKDVAFFAVKGTPGLRFSWEVKAVQNGYENYRLDDFALKTEEPENDAAEGLNEMFAQYDTETEGLFDGNIESLSSY